MKGTAIGLFSFQVAERRGGAEPSRSPKQFHRLTRRNQGPNCSFRRKDEMVRSLTREARTTQKLHLEAHGACSHPS